MKPPFQARNDAIGNRVRLSKTENVSPAITYYGWSLRQDATDTEAVWLIQRTSRSNAGIALSEWALEGQFKAVWNDRATYFPAAGSGTAAIVTPVSIFDQDGNPFDPGNPLRVTASFSGLRTAGKITPVALNDTTWTPLPATPLANRNALSIQNQSSINVKVNYDSGVAGYVGVLLLPTAERFYDITDAITIYAKAASGTPTVLVEELS